MYSETSEQDKTFSKTMFMNPQYVDANIWQAQQKLLNTRFLFPATRCRKINL